MTKSQEKPNAESTRSGVQSVEISIEILKAIAEANSRLTLSEIAKITDFARPTVHRYLISLQRGGLIQRVEESGKYDLGADAVKIGFAALRRLNSREIALKALSKLSEEVDTCLSLFDWTAEGPVLIKWLESSDPVTFTARLGTVFSPIQSVAGRLFLTHFPEEQLNTIIDREFKKTPRINWEGQAIGRLEFKSKLAEVKKRGMARGKSEIIVGVDAIGVPVYGISGEIVFAVVAVGSVGGIDTSWNGFTAQSLKRAAKALSSELGNECGERGEQEGEKIS